VLTKLGLIAIGIYRRGLLFRAGLIYYNLRQSRSNNYWEATH
jgi:hypothetical protein